MDAGPLCSRLSRHRLPDARPSGPLICDALGALFDEVILKVVPIVVPYSAISIYYQRFLEDMGGILVPRRGDGSASRHQRSALTLQDKATVSFWFLQQA